MKISVSGKLTKVSKKEASFAAGFFSKMLISDKLSDGLSLKLKFSDLDYIGGECGWLDDNVRPKEFEMSINNTFGRRKQLISMAHEMVHIKQYATRELVDNFHLKRQIVWRKTPYNFDDLDYYESPWEIDAYGRELGLYEKYKYFLF